ncbi:MAG: thiamine pyrophosphate-dependent enzyme [Chloroflexota bacterium]
MRRYELFEIIAPLLEEALVICNIGFPSQELYNIGDSEKYFYMLGSMGLSSSIGLGVSLTTSKPVVSIDGDGSVLMNLGTLSTLGNYAPKNYTLLIVDNGAYGSTGDQPTHTSGKTSLAAMAKGAGLESVYEVDIEGVKTRLPACLNSEGPHVIVVKVEPGSPKMSPVPLAPAVIRDRFRAVVAQSQ